MLDRTCARPQVGVERGAPTTDAATARAQRARGEGGANKLLLSRSRHHGWRFRARFARPLTPTSFAGPHPRLQAEGRRGGGARGRGGQPDAAQGAAGGAAQQRGRGDAHGRGVQGQDREDHGRPARAGPVRARASERRAGPRKKAQSVDVLGLPANSLRPLRYESKKTEIEQLQVSPARERCEQARAEEPAEECGERAGSRKECSSSTEAGLLPPRLFTSAHAARRPRCSPPTLLAAHAARRLRCSPPTLPAAYAARRPRCSPLQSPLC